MTDLVKRLRDLVGQHIGDADIDDELSDAADRIEKLEEEIGVLFSAHVWLNSRADLDSDGYVGRIEKLEAALRELSTDWDCCPVSQAMRRVARKALDAE